MPRSQVAENIIGRQPTTFGRIFEHEMNDALRQTITGENHSGFDWWIFPGFTNTHPEYHIPKEDRDNWVEGNPYYDLAHDAEYCRKYVDCVKKYLLACGYDMDRNPTVADGDPLFNGYSIRFYKLVESLMGLTNGGQETLAGISPAVQEWLLLAVNDFAQRSGQDDPQDQNYAPYFAQLGDYAAAPPPPDEDAPVYVMAGSVRPSQPLVSADAPGAFYHNPGFVGVAGRSRPPLGDDDFGYHNFSAGYGLHAEPDEFGGYASVAPDNDYLEPVRGSRGIEISLDQKLVKHDSCLGAISHIAYLRMGDRGVELAERIADIMRDRAKQNLFEFRGHEEFSHDRFIYC